MTVKCACVHACVCLAVQEFVALLFNIAVSRSRLSAAHVCYHVGGAQLSQWDDPQCKFSLLGVNHRGESITSSLDPSILWKTEVSCFCTASFGYIFCSYKRSLSLYLNDAHHKIVTICVTVF